METDRPTDPKEVIAALYNGGLLTGLNPEKEVVELRSETTKHFRNDDGTMTAIVGAGPLHYQKDGQWHSVLSHIFPNNSGEMPAYRYAAMHNQHLMYFPERPGLPIVTKKDGMVLEEWGNPSLVWLDAQGNVLSEMTANPAAIATVSDGDIVYPNIFPGIDAVMYNRTHSKKLNYVLKNAGALANAPAGAAYLSFRETVRTEGGLTVTQDHAADTRFSKIKSGHVQGDVLFTDRSGEAVFKVHAPVFHDVIKDGECADPGFDTTALNNDAYIEGAFLVKDKGNGELHMNLLVPMDWATAAHRKYPLTIDPITNFYPVTAITNVQWPTFTVFRGGNSGGYGCNTGQYAGRQYPASDISYGWVDTTWPVSNPYLYGYATFDISAIPNNACVLSADYNWYRYGGRTCGDAIRLKFGMVAGNADLSLPTTCDPLGNAILNNNAYYNGTGKNGNGWQNQSGNTNDVVNALSSNRITMGWAYNGGDDCCTFACGGNDGAYHNVYGFEQPTLKPYVRINYETPSVAPLNINSSQPSACIGQNTTLAIAGGTLGSGATWRWYSGSCGGTLVGTGPSITVSPNATTNYFVRAEGGCGNTSCVSITLFVNEVPGLTANPTSQTICTGTPVNINLSSNLSGTAFSWTAAATGPVTGQGAGNGNQIGQLLTNFGTVSGTVTYTVTATKDGCSSAPISIPVTVNPVPSGSATVMSNPICGGNPTNITLNSNQPGAVFNWTATGSSDLSGFGPGSGTSINQVIENTGTFSQVVTYTITPVLGTCTGASFQTFQSVLPAPTVNISTTTPSFCSGGNAFVNISPSSGTVSWTATGSPNATGFTASGSGTSIIQTLSTSDADPATVTYTATASDGGCTGSPASTSVTVLPPPSGGITGTTAICSGEPAILTFDLPSGSGPYNVVYNPGSQSLFGIQDGHTVTVWPSSHTTYSLVSITDANGCVRNSGFSSTATVTIGLPPNGTAIPGSISFCSGGTTSITLSGDQPGTTFTWTASAGSGSPSGFSSGSGNSISQTLTNLGPGIASVMYLVTPALGTCTGPQFPVMATVRPIPTLTPNATEQTICSGQQTNITFTPNPPTATSAWTVSVDPGIGNHAPGNGLGIQQTLTNTSISEGVATYTVTPVWGTGVNQCLGEPFQIPVTVNVIPSITTTPATQTICTGTEANIGLSSPVTGTSFSWTSVAVGGATGHSGGSGNTISQTLTNNATTVGTVTYTINASVTGCTASSVNATVTVNPRPNATLGGISPICFGEGTDITLNASPGVGPFDITLTDGTDTYDFPAVANGGSVPLQPDATTTYSLVSLTDNTTGCERTSGFTGSTTVTVNPLPAVSMDGIASSYCESDADAVVAGNQGSAGNFSGWSGLVANPDGTVTFSPSQAGPGGPYNVSYTYTDGNGCTNVASVDVTVDAQPTANGGSDAFICDALTHTLNATPSAFFGGWTATGPGTAAFSDVLSATSSADVSEAGVYEFNWIVVNGDCSASDTVEVTFAEPEAEPTTACFETATFNTTTCAWDVTGTQPAEPTTACYETATFNTTTCAWDVTGTQPAEPTTACYETATFNTTTCAWDVTGTQPAEPTTACYETATFNTTTCAWDVTGTQPAEPTTACYETTTFNTTTCAWDVTGTQPAEPTTACYETATFNTTTCAWDVTGTQPAEPTTACYETATFNTTTCAWDVTGTQPSSSIEETACGSYEAPDGAIYTVTGEYTAIVQNAAGCDSIITIDLTVIEVTATTTTESVCDSYTWSVNGETYTSSGTYTVVDGCHTETLVLTVSPSTTTTVTESACDNYTWAVNATTYTESGSYSFTNECGTQILDLTIAPSSTVTTTEAVCDSYTWSVNGETYTESGTYSVVNGCETQELVLTVSPSTTTTVTESACDSYTWSVNATTYTESGSYTFTNECGTQILDLTIAPSSTVTTTEAVCDSYTWSVNGQTYTESGTYSVVNGCETQELVLTVTPSTTTTVTESACDSYTWNQNSQVYSESGTYTVVSGCDTHVLELTIGDEVTVSISGVSGSYCATDNNQYTLVASPTGGTFSGPGVSGSTFSPSDAGAGSHTISYSYSDPTGCTGYGEIVVEIGASLQVTMSGLGSMYCTTSQPVQLSGNPAGGVFSGPGVSGNVFSPSVAGQGSYTISYMFEDDFGCMGTATQTVNVSNVAAPIISASGPTTFCAGQSVTLTASSGFQDYSWSNSQSGPSITVSSAGSITVTATHPASGCQATSEPMMVTVNPNPTVNLGQNVTICPGGSTTLNAGNPGATYSWTPSGETTQQVTVSEAGAYSVTVTDNNGCSGSGQVTVSLGSSLSPTITPNGPTAFCEGTSLVLNANVGYSTYTWSTSGTGQSITVTEGGTYEVEVTDGSGCSGTASITVSTVAAPSPTIISTGGTVVCQGSTVSLSVTAGFSSYSWSPGGQTTQTIDVTGAGSYAATVTNANGCSGTSNTITITSGQTVQPTIVASGPLEFCQGGSVTLTVEPAFASYSWNSGQTSQSITVNSSGSYAPTVTDASGCVNSSLLDNPIVVSVTNPQPVIEENGNVLTVTNGPFADYQWFINGNPIPGATSVSFMPGESGNIRVQVTDANGCEGTSWNYEFTFVGITDAGSTYGIKVYPNPNNGIFTIEAELGRHTDVVLEIRDLLGRELMQSERIEGTSSFRRNVDMTHLANGTYLLRLSGREGVSVLRVVKQ